MMINVGALLCTRKIKILLFSRNLVVQVACCVREIRVFGSPTSIYIYLLIPGRFSLSQMTQFEVSVGRSVQFESHRVSGD